MSINPILARFQDEPAFLGNTSRAWFESCVEQAATMLAKVEAEEAANPVKAEGFWYAADDYRSAYRPYNVRNGVLQIPVKGTLLNNFPYSFSGWATGYDYIYEAMKRGVNDPDVKGIAMVIDSPGGMVNGMLELADRVFGMRGKKPIKAFAADAAYSAAYCLACAADDITVTRSGGVGSIGVVTMHVDYSAMMAEAGVKVTYIFAGKHKVDGNPYEALPEAVRGRIQERVDALYDEFVSTVARNRGMDEKAVRKTEALTYAAQEAIDAGLADQIGALDDAITAFAATFNEEEEPMAKENEAPTISAADVDAARKEGMTAGALAEQTRIQAILGSDEAKARPAVAQKLAFTTRQSADEAKAFMADLPEEVQPQANTQSAAPGAGAPGAGAPGALFDAAMDNSQNPNLGAEHGSGVDQPQMSRAQRALNISKGQLRKEN